MTLGIQSATLIYNIGGNPVILHSHECGREWSRSAKYLEKVHRNSRALRSELGRGPEKRFHWPLSALTEELNQFEIAKSRIFTKVVNRFPFKTITYDKLNLHTICCSGNDNAVQRKPPRYTSSTGWQPAWQFILGCFPSPTMWATCLFLKV